MKNAPPTVPGLPLLGSLLPLQRDALAFFTHCLQEHGDRVRLRVLGKDVLLLTHPDDLQQVLINDRDSYGRSVEVQNLSPIFGQGLLTSDGALWKQQRRLIQPKFTQAAMAAYADGMVSAMEQRIATWKHGETRDLYPEMMTYTRDVICQALFGSADTAPARRVSNAVRVIFGDLRAEILYLPLWRRLPLPKSRRWDRAVRDLNRAIAEIVAERRTSPGGGNDMLDLLLGARDEDGNGMSPEQVHDEVMTIFLAGHESSAVMMTWALGLMAHHPEIQEKLFEEATHAPLDARRLPLIAATVQETMRLYPSVWTTGRLATRDTAVGDVPVRSGTHLWLCIHRTHHDPRWWQEPEEFQPDRWMDGGTPLRQTYLPFGLGPRMCIGQHLVTLEGVLGLAVLLRRFRVEPVGAAISAPDAWITLRPREGMPLRLIAR